MRRIEKTCSWWTTSIGLIAALLVVAACGGQNVDLGSKASTTGRQMLLSDSGTVNVVVADNKQCKSGTTSNLALIDYFGADGDGTASCTATGSSGTGVFLSFVRLQGSPNEAGYNTDGTLEFDTKSGAWTHAVKVSDIPVVMYNGHPYWELYSDINETNSTTYISLNKLEVYLTDDQNLTGYPFTSHATQVYAYSGQVQINDVNAGSGRADLRYRIPLDSSAGSISIPANCGYKNPACATYFVLYTQWGTASGSDQYASDGGYEEWKVKTYPYVTVSKTGTTSFKRTYGWTIAKSVTPAAWNLFTGDSGTSRYTVSVVKDSGTDSDYSVSGTITINNPGTLDAVITDLPADSMAGATVTCPTVTSWPYTLAAGQSLICNYSTPTVATNPAGDTNTATVTLAEQTVFSGSATITAGTTPSSTVNNSIDVTDSYQGGTPTAVGTFSASGSANYTRTFTCNTDSGSHSNTATITQTGQYSSASVTVNCYEITVSKTANTSFTRTYTWGIDKWADKTEIELATDQQYVLHYSVQVNTTGSTDSAWAAAGNITVHNPAPMAATINSVGDVISGVPTTATVDCGVTFPYTLAASGDLNCTYSASLPNATSQTNTATATRQNYSYDYQLNATAGTTTAKTGTASVTFSSTPTTKVDDCVTVTDTYNSATLGTACVGVDTLPKTFTYDRTVSFTAAECGDHNIDNTATFTTDDTATTGHDDNRVIAHVPCPVGCTLTQGYWKTHSSYGKAPYDETWAQVTDGTHTGADTTFFLSQMSWYNVFWTPPKGNPYYNLAHQYEAAVLNVLSNTSTTFTAALSGGTGVTQVDAAMLWAKNFFNTYTPAQAGALGKTLQQQVIQNAGILGSYNEGKMGVPHCSEDNLSSNSP